MNAGRSALLIAVAVLVSAAACRSDETPEAATNVPVRPGSLPSGVVARVGSADVHETSVARIAAAQGLDRERARDAAVREALLASESGAQELDRSPAVRFAIQSALARLLLRDLLTAAKRAGPVTDDELRDATEFHWLELDRPPGFRTVHAVVRLDPKADAARRRAAMELAESIHRALEPVLGSAAAGNSLPLPALSDSLIESFKQAASAVPHERFDVTIEALPPIAADGRVLEPGDRVFDPDFARAVSSLVRRGDLSSPIITPFGVHVIMLLERLPPRVFSAEERRVRVHDEVIAARARAAQRTFLERARDATFVERSVDALLALVPVDR